MTWYEFNTVIKALCAFVHFGSIPFGCRGQCLFPGYGNVGAVSVRLAAAGATVSDTGHGESLTQRCLTCTTHPETGHFDTEWIVHIYSTSQKVWKHTN